MNMESQENGPLTIWQSQFFYWLAGGVVLMLFSHWFGGMTPGNNARLLLVCIFFFAAFSLVWAFSQPFADYLNAIDSVKYRHAPETILNSTKQFRIELIRFVGHITIFFNIFITIVFLRVLAVWPIFSFLAPYRRLLMLACWIAPPIFLLFLIMNTSRIRMLVSLTQSIHRQIQTIEFMPDDAEILKKEQERFAAPAVLVEAAERFDIGGMDLAFVPELRANVIVFGQIGSGKTVTVLNSLLEGVLLSTAPGLTAFPISALILDPKGDFRDKISTLCQRIGRERDLLIFDPKAPDKSVHWNPFDSPDSNPLELSNQFASVLALLGMKSEKDSFFIDSAKSFIRHGITLLRAFALDGTPPSMSELYDLAKKRTAIEARLFLLNFAAALKKSEGNSPLTFGKISEALNKDDLGDTLDGCKRDAQENVAEYFKHFLDVNTKGLNCRAVLDEVQALLARIDADKIVPDGFTGVAAETQDYMLTIWWTLPENTRSSVIAQLSTMLDPFTQAPYSSLLSGRSTVSLDKVLDDGKIFYVCMPEADGPQMAKTLNTLIKLAYFREVRRRLDKKRPSLFLCDEYQKVFTSEGGEGDTGFFEVSRQSHHINIIATQSTAAMKRDVENKETVDSLLACCGTKIFLRNTDADTNEYAEKQCGARRELVVNVSSATGQGGGKSGGQVNYSINESYDDRPLVPKDIFLKLGVPDKDKGVNYAEAVVMRKACNPPKVERIKFKVNPL